MSFTLDGTITKIILETVIVISHAFKGIYMNFTQVLVTVDIDKTDPSDPFFFSVWQQIAANTCLISAVMALDQRPSQGRRSFVFVINLEQVLLFYYYCCFPKFHYYHYFHYLSL